MGERSTRRRVGRPYEMQRASRAYPRALIIGLSALGTFALCLAVWGWLELGDSFDREAALTEREHQLEASLEQLAQSHQERLREIEGLRTEQARLEAALDDAEERIERTDEALEVVEADRQSVLAARLATQVSLMRERAPNDQVQTRVLLAVEAARRDSSPDVEAVLRREVDDLAQRVDALSPPGGLLAFAVEPSGDRYTAVTGDLMLRTMSRRDNAERVRMVLDAPPLALEATRDTVLAAVPTEDGGLVILDALTGEERVRLELVEDDSNAAAATFAPDGATVAVASEWTRPGISLFDVESGALIAWLPAGTPTLGSGDDPCECDPRLVFSPDGRYLSSSYHRNVLELWTVPEGRLARRLAHPYPIQAWAFSGDGRTLATATSDASRVWQMEPIGLSGRLGDAGATCQLAVDTEGDRAATVECDMSDHVSLWAIGGGDPPLATTDLSQPITSLTFGPMGAQLAVASGTTVFFLDPRDGSVHFRLLHSDVVAELVWLSGGRDVATATVGGRIQFGSLVPLDDEQSAISAACERVARNLTRSEWQSALGSEPYRPTCPQWPEPAPEASE